MSSKVSASPSTAQTAITRMSSKRCSTFHPQRGSSIDANSVIRASSMAFPSLGKGRALARQRAGIEPADLVRSPCTLHGVLHDSAFYQLGVKPILVLRTGACLPPHNVEWRGPHFVGPCPTSRPVHGSTETPSTALSLAEPLRTRRP